MVNNSKVCSSYRYIDQGLPAGVASHGQPRCNSDPARIYRKLKSRTFEEKKKHKKKMIQNKSNTRRKIRRKSLEIAEFISSEHFFCFLNDVECPSACISQVAQEEFSMNLGSVDLK